MSRRRKSPDFKSILILLLLAIVIVLLVVFIARLIDTPPAEDATAASGSAEDKIVFLDVRQGDGALIKSGTDSAVIDTGTPEGASDFCEKLKKMGVTAISTLLLTHNHDDHVGGAGKLAQAFKIKTAVLPDVTNSGSPTRILGTVTNEVTADGGSCTVGRSGLTYNIGNIKITVLCCYLDLKNENDRSIICIAQMSGKKFLFTGDAGSPAEKRMLDDGLDIDCDVLKVGHHGSKGSSSAKFLAAVTPEYAVISCGEGNSYGHPHDEALARLKTVGAQILRTDKRGDITFYVSESALAYKTEK